MSVKKLKTLLESKTEEIRCVIESNIASKGCVESECQRLCLLNRLSDFEHYVNGIVDSDLK